MKIAIALGLGSLLTLTATTLTARADSEGSPPFRAEIAGGIAARPTGDARFGITGGTDGAPAVFTISLGAGGASGSILFTRRSGAPLVPGTYKISAREDRTDDLRALVMTGSASRPTGVFQGQRGSLVVTYASEREIRGSFRLEATGFLAAAPEVEDRPITASGLFIASR